MAEQISLGQGIGLQDKQPDYTHEVLTTMRLADKELRDDAKLKRQQQLQRKKDVEKYDIDLKNFIIGADSGLWGGYHKDTQAYAAKIFDRIRTERAKDDDYNPRADSELQKLIIDMKSDSDEYKQATNRLNNDIQKAKTLHPEDITLNKELADIVQSGDKQKLLDYQTKQAKETGLEHLVNPKGLYYGGLYELNDKPTTFLPLLQSDASKLGQQAVRIDNVNGKEVRVSTATPEQIKSGFEAFALTNKSYQKFRNNAIVAEETNPETGQPFKDQNEVDNYFAKRYAASVKQSYANMPIPAEVKAAEQISSPTAFKDNSGNIIGSRVSSIKGGSVKTTLIVPVRDESGKENETELENVPIQHIVNLGSVKKPDLKVNITVPEWVSRKMTDDEKKKEDERVNKANKMAMSADEYVTPTYSVKEKKQVSKTIDIPEGSNNYNALISMPGMKKNIDYALSHGIKDDVPTKSYKIKGKDYSESAIQKAARASNMPVDEYIREANK